MKFEVNYEILNANYSPGKNLNFRDYKDEFSSIIKKDKVIGKIDMNLGDTLLDIKKKVSEITHFPIEIMSFGKYSYYDKEKNTNIIAYYNNEKNEPIPDTTLIKDSIYNSEDKKLRTVYIYIDIKKSPSFKFLNDNANIVDIKKRIKDLKTKYEEVNEDLEDKFNTNSSDIDLLDTRISTLRTDYNNIKKDYSDLSLKIDENKIEFEKMKKEKENLEKKIEEQNNNINELNIEINELKEKLDKEIKNNKDLIQKEKQKEIICKNSFDNINNNINEKIIDEFKIIISIIKSFYFLKIENNDFNDFILKHLYTYINEFVDNFIDYTGKSTLINELLNLKGDKMAEEGRKYTTTKEIKKYISEEEGINKIRIYDTPGSGFTKDLDSMLEDVNILVNLKENNNNIIFYCEKAENERFNEEEVLTIKKIMGLYGDYDLPVIIVLTKSWEENESKTKKNDTKENLEEFLKEPKLINKIGIVNVLARDIVKSNTNYSSYGLDELLKTAFDMKNKSGNIISEMKSKLEQDMKKLEIDFISNKTEELDEIIKNENDYFNLIISKKDTNNYNYLENKSWDNYLKEKIKQIYKILNNISNNNKIKRDFIIYLDKKVKDLSKMITPLYNILYNLLEKYSSIYYFTYMEKEQIKLNEKYQTNNKIENLEEKEKKLKDILYNIFNKEFYESFTCGTIKIFYDYLKIHLNKRFISIYDMIKIEDQQEQLSNQINNLKQYLNKNK